MKNLGIWIDKERAHLVTLENETEKFTTIKSEVENYHPSGGFGLGFRGSPQDAMTKKKYMEREKQQLKSYFKNIVSEIKDADAIAIFGPAQTGEKFRNELNENYIDVSVKVKGIKKADSMTDNQIIAWVKDFFK
jgi:stalled ribosome rescue protein Dom34